MKDGVTTEAGRAPTTKAGLAFMLFRGNPDMWEYAALVRNILAIENEAVENERRRLYEAVERLPHLLRSSREGWQEADLVDRTAVLALLAPPAEKEQT